MPAPHRNETARRTLRWLLLLAIAVAAVLWRPLSSAGTRTFSSGDLISRASTLTRTDEPPARSNSILSDPPLQMHPWTLFNVQELRAGRLPAWNPYNGAGIPHLANYQAAPFSPFSLPYHFAPFKAALLLEAFAKLLGLALGTFLLLRAYSLGEWPAFAGALLLTCAGMPLLYLQYPHTGVLVALPFALLAIERIAQRVARGERRIAHQALLFGSAALAVLGGHPETLLYVALTSAVVAAWRIAATPIGRVPLALALGVPAVLGAGVGAIQALPFLEYLPLSEVVEVNRFTASALDPRGWPLQFFPDLAGTPVGDRLLAVSLPSANYEEANSFRVGAVALLAFALAPLAAWRLRAARPFLPMAAVCCAYAYDLGGVASWCNQNTWLHYVPILRSQPPWTLGVCVLAACALHERSTAAPSWRGAGRALAVGAALWMLFRLGAERYLEHVAKLLDRDLGAVRAQAGGHIAEVGLAFGLALLALVAHERLAPGPWRRAAQALVILACLLDGGRIHGRYTPTTEDRFVYPRTAATAELERIVAGSRLVFAGSDALRPDSNILYGIELPNSYDGMELLATQRLLNELFGTSRVKVDTTSGSRAALELFGIRYVADSRNRVFAYERAYPQGILPQLDVPAVLPRLGADPKVDENFLPLPTEQPLRVRFTAVRPQLDGVSLHVVRDPEQLDARVALALTDLRDQRVVASAELEVGTLAQPAPGRADVWLPFEPIADSQDRQFSLAVRAVPSRRGGPLLALAVTRRFAEPQEDGARGGRLALDRTFGRADFELAGKAGAHSVYRYTPSRGRAWWVGRASFSADREEIAKRVVAPAFEPYAEVLLEGSDPPEASASGEAQVVALEESPQRMRYRVAASERGWLVLAQSWYPGWQARVDGRASELRRANYAFKAVEVPAGEHEVVFEYESGALRWGALLSAASALCGLGLLAAAGLRARRA